MSIKVVAYCRVSTDSTDRNLIICQKMQDLTLFISYPKVKDEYKVKDTDKIPAIISRDLFYKCKDIMHSKTNYKNQCGIYNGNSKYKNFIYYYP